MAEAEDMNTMPIRDLIASLRVQASELPPADMIRMLFVHCMVNRLEQQANLADRTIALLRVAACPDVGCGGQGYSSHQVADGVWEQEQCQFCAEKEELCG